MPLSDKQLIERFIDKQDEDAFEQLVRRHSPMVWEVCRRLLWQTQDAEDAYQVAFILLSTHAKKLTEYRSIGGWLHGVAVRTCLNRRRQVCRNREMCIETNPVSGEVEPWRKIALSRDHELLHQAIVELPKRYREAVVLCLLEGKSRTEAATILQCTKTAVKAALARGRRLLRNKLIKQGMGPSAVWTVLATSSIAHAAASASAATQTLSPTEPLIRSTIEICTSPAAQVPQTLAPLVQSLTQKKLLSASSTSHSTVLLVSAAMVLGALLAGSGTLQLDWQSRTVLRIISPEASELMTAVHLEAVLISEPLQEDEEVPEPPFVDDYRSRQKLALKNELKLIVNQLGLGADVIETICDLVQDDLDEAVQRFAESWSTKTRSVFIFSDRLDPTLRKAVWKKAEEFVSPEKVSRHTKLAVDADELFQMYHASSQQEVIWFLAQLLSLSAEQQSKVKTKLAEAWDLEWTELFQYQIGLADESVCRIVGSLDVFQDILNPAQQKVFDNFSLLAAVSYPDLDDPKARIWNSTELKQQCRAVMDLKLDWMEKRYQLSADQRARLDVASKGAISNTDSIWQDTFEKLYGEENLSQKEMEAYLDRHPFSQRCISSQCTSTKAWIQAIEKVLDDQQLEKWNADQELAWQAFHQWNVDRAVFVISSGTSLSLEQHRKLVDLLQNAKIEKTDKPSLHFVDELVSQVSEEELDELRELLSDSQAASILSWFEQ